MEARAHRFIEAQRRAEPGEYEATWPFKMPCRSYQLKIFAAARHMKFIALAPVVMGSGKTKMLIDIAADKFMRGAIDCVAVVAAPRGVHRQWVNEALPAHMTDAVKWVGAVWKSTSKTNPAVMRANGRRSLRFLTFNVEAFSTDSGKAAKALREFMESGRCFLIEDESSRIKSHRAARTKAFIGEWVRGKHKPGLAELATCRAISSGTPITKGLEDLWSQYEFLDPNAIGMSNFFAFRARYCVTVPAYRGAALGAVKITGYRNMEEFVRKIAPYTFVVPKSVLGLPPIRREELPVELTKEQSSIYTALRKKLVEDLKAKRIATPANAAVRFLRLQQVLCGRVYEVNEDEDEPPVCKSIPSYRVATLVEYLEANPGPTVIWARFTNDILEIEAALIKAGRNPVTYYGATSDDDREAKKKLFKAGGATDFVSNPSVGGMGVDGLQEAAEQAVYYSGSFNREHRWQSIDRIDRLGKKNMTTSSLIVDMVVPNSVDRMILDSYEKTGNLVQSLMDRPEMIPVLSDE